MPGTVIGISMNVGWPGSFSRNPDDIIVPRRVTGAAITPGDPVVLNNDNTYSPFGAADGLADFAGIAVRMVKNLTANFTAQSGEPDYAVGEICDVLERGNINVTVRRGTPAAGGAVYVRTVLGMVPDAGAVVGGLEAAVPGDGGTSIQLTNLEWATGVMDGNNVAEVCIKTRNRA